MGMRGMLVALRILTTYVPRAMTGLTSSPPHRTRECTILARTKWHLQHAAIL